MDFIPLALLRLREPRYLTSRALLIFAGFGISAPELGHDDYAHMDVRAKIVLVLDHEPGENDPDSPFDGLVTSEAAHPLRKALTAQEKGAVGILFVADVHNHREPENFEAPPRGRLARPAAEDRALPAAGLGRARPHPGSRDLDRHGPEDPARTRTGRSRSSPAVPRQPGDGRRTALDDVTVRLAIDVRHDTVPDRNVLAAIEGSDPELKDEWVDHLLPPRPQRRRRRSDLQRRRRQRRRARWACWRSPRRTPWRPQAGHRPKRSVLFAAFNSEERGLLGS